MIGFPSSSKVIHATEPPPLSTHPSNCPPNPLARRPIRAPAVIPPLWLTVPHPTIDLSNYPVFVYQPGYGWGFKYVWYVKSGFKGRAVIQGDDVRGAHPLWFADDLHHKMVRVLVLDVQQFLGMVQK